MRTSSLFLFLALATVSAKADDVAVTLVTPVMRHPAGTEISVDLLWLNEGGRMERVRPPATIDAMLRQSDAVWPVHLRAAEVAPAEASRGVASDSFLRRTYVFAVPRDARGICALTIEEPFSAQSLIEVVPSAAVADARSDAADRVAAPALRPVASRLHRTVLQNFSFHEPIYFLYGPDEPVAKFQLSFRYRLAGRSESPIVTDPPAKGLYLAYTQRSLWNIKEPSSPFYDTSYMPELMFESLATERPGHRGLVNFIGWQAGYRHESNGRDGLDSRSLDIVYVRSGILIGLRDGWRAVVVPRLFAYISDSSDNSDIEDYRGYGELLLSLGREDGIQVNLTAMVGRHGDKGSVQVDATYPVKIPSVHFDTFVHLQYFDGYGESLRDYNRKSSTWRAGLSLVR